MFLSVTTTFSLMGIGWSILSIRRCMHVRKEEGEGESIDHNFELRTFRTAPPPPTIPIPSCPPLSSTSIHNRPLPPLPTSPIPPIPSSEPGESGYSQIAP
jgi:hypothetical protein